MFCLCNFILNTPAFSGAPQRKESTPKNTFSAKRKKPCLAENVTTFTFPGRPAEEKWQESLQEAATFAGIAHSAGSFMWHHNSWRGFFSSLGVVVFTKGVIQCFMKRTKKMCSTEQAKTDLNFLFNSPRVRLVRKQRHLRKYIEKICGSAGLSHNSLLVPAAQ